MEYYCIEMVPSSTECRSNVLMWHALFFKIYAYSVKVIPPFKCDVLDSLE